MFSDGSDNRAQCQWCAAHGPKFKGIHGHLFCDSGCALRYTAAAGLPNQLANDPPRIEDSLAIVRKDRVEKMLNLIKLLAAPTYSDEKTFALYRYAQGKDWAAERLHEFSKRAKELL